MQWLRLLWSFSTWREVLRPCEPGRHEGARGQVREGPQGAVSEDAVAAAAAVIQHVARGAVALQTGVAR